MKHLIFALALVACAQPPSPGVTPTTPAPATPSAFPENTSTLLAGDAANALGRQCSRVSPGPIDSQWNPKAQDLAELETALPRELAARLANAGVTAAPSDYYRQYAGFVIAGRRVIYVNGIERGAVERAPGPVPFDWRTQAVQICDGGTITFGVEYDPATAAFANFAFNGGF